MSVSVLVPWRDSGDEHRRRAWDWVQRRWTALHPTWEVVARSCGDGQWNFSAAANECARAASGDVFVLTGADLACKKADVEAVAATVDGWAMPFTRLHSLDLAQTIAVVDTDPAEDLPTVPRTTTPNLGCGMLAITADAWQAVDGMDERFSVWGCEDNALGHALQRIVGGPQRHYFDLWALGHPRDPQRRRTGQWHKNRALYLRYRSARTPDAMRTIIAERQ